MQAYLQKHRNSRILCLTNSVCRSYLEETPIHTRALFVLSIPTSAAELGSGCNHKLKRRGLPDNP